MDNPHEAGLPASQAIATTLDWIAREPDHLADEMSDALAALGTRYAREGRQAEFAAALLKFYVVATSRPVLYGTDEDVYALSLKARKEYYGEAIRFRRAILQDISRGGP